MKFNFKKISTILTCGFMIMSTIGFSMAANYPKPFIVGGTSNAAIVYGTGIGISPLDGVNAINIHNDLKDLITTGAVSAPTEEFVKIEKSSTKFHLGKGARDVITTSITEDSPGDGLPILLKEGTFLDADNDEFDYSQKIKLSNLSLNMWADNDYEVEGENQEDNPTVGIMIESGENVFDYTLDFTDEPLWKNLPYTNIEIMGKEYFILDYTINNSLSLLDSAETTTLEEGDTTILSGHTVKINFIGSSTVKLDIDGTVTNTLSAGETQKLSGGDYVGVKEINTQDYAGGIKNIEFSIGNGKLKLVSGSDVRLNDETLSGLGVILSSEGSGSGDKLTKIKLIWNTDEDLFITPTSEITMPGFGGIKLSFTGMHYPSEEEVIFEAGGDDYITLKDFPLADTTVDIDFVYSNGTDYVGTGKDSTHQLLVSNTDQLIYNGETHKYVVASWNDGSSCESHLIRFNNFAKDNQKNITTIQYHKDGFWVDKKENANNLDTISIGNVELLIDNIDYSSKSVNVSSLNNGVSFNKLFSEECLTVNLPTIVLNNQSLNISNPQALDVQLIEEDKNGNIGEGNKFNITFGFDGSSNNDVEVSGVKGESVSFDEIEDTDVWRSFIYSSLGTEFLWDKSSESLKLIYHGDESYGEVYLTSEASETKTTTSDVLLITDAEIASVGSRNLVIVGGSCINSAAASLVGGSHCGSEWTTATGIGVGEFLIKGYANSTITSELALLVAGYEVIDTQNAVSYLQTFPVDTDKEYKGTTSTKATII